MPQIAHLLRRRLTCVAHLRRTQASIHLRFALSNNVFTSQTPSISDFPSHQASISDFPLHIMDFNDFKVVDCEFKKQQKRKLVWDNGTVKIMIASMAVHNYIRRVGRDDEAFFKAQKESYNPGEDDEAQEEGISTGRTNTDDLYMAARRDIIAHDLGASG